MPGHKSWPLNKRDTLVLAVEKIPACNVALDGRRFAATRPPPLVRVDAFQQQLVDNHAQSEPIVIHVTIHLVESVPLKVWRRVFGFPNGASVDRPIALIEYLEGVCVNQSHESVSADHDVRFVDVADDIVAVVDGIHVDCNVYGNGA